MPPKIYIIKKGGVNMEDVDIMEIKIVKTYGEYILNIVGNKPLLIFNNIGLI